jgi:hypothetical protein
MTTPYPDVVQHTTLAVLPVSYVILITDETLQVVGDPITDWVTLDVTIKLNEPSTGLFTAPAYPAIYDQLAAGHRVVIMRYVDDGDGSGYTGTLLIAGPIEQWLYERSDDGENAGVGKLTVNFADDIAKIVARQTYPNPAQTAAGQTSDVWSYTGNAETALRTLVDLNAGPGALQARRIPQLVLGTAAGVGTAVTVVADRMQPIGDVMRQIADVGGRLVFTTTQVGTAIVFAVAAPVDRTNTVRFGFGIGNLKYVSYEVNAPKATTVIVGGQGEGADRVLDERQNTTEETTWGRYERLLSRPGTSETLLDDADKELADNAATTRLASNVADTADQRFGVHYTIGDIVTVETLPGQQISDQVLTVHLQAWPTSGEYVQATVGSEAATTDPAWVTRLRDIEERLGTVERNMVRAAVP